MSGTTMPCLCWTSLLVKSSFIHAMSIKPAFQGVGSVPGGSANATARFTDLEKRYSRVTRGNLTPTSSRNRTWTSRFIRLLSTDRGSPSKLPMNKQPGLSACNTAKPMSRPPYFVPMGFELSHHPLLQRTVQLVTNGIKSWLVVTAVVVYPSAENRIIHMW